MREVSKMFQEVIRSDLAGILVRVRDGVKGELVLVVEGAGEETGDSWKAEAERMFHEGMSVKDIVSNLEGIAPKNEVKQYVINFAGRISQKS